MIKINGNKERRGVCFLKAPPKAVKFEEELKEAIKILDLQDLKRARNFISELLTRGL